MCQQLELRPHADVIVEIPSRVYLKCTELLLCLSDGCAWKLLIACDIEHFDNILIGIKQIQKRQQLSFVK